MGKIWSIGVACSAWARPTMSYISLVVIFCTLCGSQVSLLLVGVVYYSLYTQYTDRGAGGSAKSRHAVVELPRHQHHRSGVSGGGFQGFH